MKPSVEEKKANIMEQVNEGHGIVLNLPKSVSHTYLFTEKAFGKQYLHSNRNLTLLSEIWPFRVIYFKIVKPSQ